MQKLVKQNDKKVQYVIKPSSFINNIGNILKQIFKFFFFLFKILIVFTLFVAIIPCVASLLIVSGMLFSNISFENTELFGLIHLWFKIGVVGILLSITFITLGTIGKLLKGKTFSNILVVIGITGFLSFIFIGSIGFFNTYQNYINSGMSIQELKTNIEKVISEENFLSIVNNNSITCTNKEDGEPIILSLSNYYGTIDSQIQIHGCNFSGFEGDEDIWIENSEGQTGFIQGDFKTSTSNLIDIKLEALICTKNTSYTGEACEEWIQIIPGTYKIYTAPWGKMSNKIQFEVIK